MKNRAGDNCQNPASRKADVVQGNSPQAENPAAWILPAERNGHAGNDSRKKLPYRK